MRFSYGQRLEPVMKRLQTAINFIYARKWIHLYLAGIHRGFKSKFPQILALSPAQEFAAILFILLWYYFENTKIFVTRNLTGNFLTESQNHRRHKRHVIKNITFIHNRKDSFQISRNFYDFWTFAKGVPDYLGAFFLYGSSNAKYLKKRDWRKFV